MRRQYLRGAAGPTDHARRLVTDLAAIRLALSLAATYQAADRTLDRAVQMEIEREVFSLGDREIAMRERDTAIRAAFRECRYSVKTLEESASAFVSNCWPARRWMADPPPGDGPLFRALLAACRASCALSADGSPLLPGRRQLYEIVQSGPMECTPDLGH